MLPPWASWPGGPPAAGTTTCGCHSGECSDDAMDDGIWPWQVCQRVRQQTSRSARTHARSRDRGAAADHMRTATAK